jgi:hypothetical protein
MQDDVEALRKLIARTKVSPFVWTAWRNKGGKTLLDLAHERSKENVYTWMILAAGRAQFLAPDRVKDGDTVWVFLPTSLQPRQGKVIMDSDAPYDPHALVEVSYFDEDEGTHMVEPTRVRKMATS